MVSSIGGTGGTGASYSSQMVEKMFKAKGTTGDGKLDAGEIHQAWTGGSQSSTSLDSLFSAFDSDGDDVISELELDSGLSILFQEMKNQSVDAGSSSDRSAELFAMMDGNGDGGIDQDEMTQFQANAPHGPPPPGGPPPGGLSTEELFSEMDTDESGGISENEFTEAMAETEESSTAPVTSAAERESSETDISRLLISALQSYLKNAAGDYAEKTATTGSVSSYA